ncbi:prominin-1-A-like isoform X2 [Sinocyclocheilus rhinocerous]|uniref:prominin-1-A-like isoform X2 n=1 Tax=Sinocyclocheilus rhinocerous TaxID=307959 RepID=UPI0007BA59C5|nr:PREDICTED: prominin-1-A-like isoform X2 [Sinocyclocheilus rhinocerous]
MWWKVGLVLVMCSGLTSSEAREERRDSSPRSMMLRVPVETLDFGFVPSVVYETHAYYEPGPIGVLFHMVHAFLYVVQPNPFPKDLIIKMVQQNMGGIKGNDYKKPENVVLFLQAIFYELGFIVLTVLGVIFVLFMPIVGLCFCVCRCCENCGGEMHQRQKKNGDCLRGFYMATLVATSVFLAVGVTVACAANQNITNQIKSTRRLVSTNIRDLKSFANYTPAQIDYLSAQYITAKNKVLSDLDNIGTLLGGQIHNHLEREVVPALDNALRMTAVKVEGAIKAMREAKEALESVTTSLEILQEGTGRLQNSLQSERASLSNTLNDPACSNGDVTHTCKTIRGTLSQLALSANFHGLPDVEAPLANLDAVLKTDLSNIVQKGYSSFNDTPRLVSEQTKEIVSALPKVKGLLDKSGGEIIGFTKMFPLEPALENFTKFLTESQKNIEAYYPQIDQLDFYRWIGCVVICCMVVLVLAFNFLGLLCGSCGYDKNATPTTRGCLSNTGGNLLMASVGFSFIFSWVLMGVVVTTFVVGGNIEKLVCEPLANRQIFKIIDIPYMVHPAKKNFLPGMLFQDPNIDLTIGSMYRDCYENNGLYSALQLETKFNFNKFLNATVYNPELTKIFNSVNVDLQGMFLLEQEGKDNLIDFANTGIGDIDYQAYLTEVNKGVTVVDLLSYANELEAQADQLPRGALENALKGHASSIRQIHKEKVVPMEQAMGTLSQSIKLLQKTSRELPIKVTNVLNAIEAVEYLIANNASHVVKQGTDKFIKNIVGYFSQYTEWVKHSLEMEIAQCKPISNIIDSLEIVACSFIVDSVNTFWFGLGGCCLLLIPSIIMSVKLGKFYRRMDTEDVYDDSMDVVVSGYHNESLYGINNPVMSSYPSYDTMRWYPRASAPPRQPDW